MDKNKDNFLIRWCTSMQPFRSTCKSAIVVSRQLKSTPWLYYPLKSLDLFYDRCQFLIITCLLLPSVRFSSRKSFSALSSHINPRLSGFLFSFPPFLNKIFLSNLIWFTLIAYSNHSHCLLLISAIWSRTSYNSLCSDSPIHLQNFCSEHLA